MRNLPTTQTGAATPESTLARRPGYRGRESTDFRIKLLDNVVLPPHEQEALGGCDPTPAFIAGLMAATGFKFEWLFEVVPVDPADKLEAV